VSLRLITDVASLLLLSLFFTEGDTEDDTEGCTSRYASRSEPSVTSERSATKVK
jgi:hypothetical protein